MPFKQNRYVVGLWVIGLMMLSQPASANQSLVLNPGVIVNFTVPSVPIFRNLGSNRLEMRIHDVTFPTGGPSTVYESQGWRIFLRKTGEVCAQDLIDTQAAFGDNMCINITGHPDVTIRAQRDLAASLVRYEAWSSAGDWTGITYCGNEENGTTANTFSCPITVVGTRTWAGPGTLGDANTKVSIAWLKWFSTLVDAGQKATEFIAADLTDWRFEGNKTNQGSYNVQLGGGGTFGVAPSYPPICSAGTQQTYRAGMPAALDGTNSTPADGAISLRFQWQQISGPSSVFRRAADTAQPLMEGLVFGTYVFQLTVTDSSNQSTSCTVQHGAVATDDDGVVILPDPRLNTLIGPLIRFGANPWPWYDDRHKALVEAQIANLGVGRPYGPWWRDFNTIPANTGTISVTGGSVTITGSGTTFSAAVQTGTTPKGGAVIMIRYTGTDGRTHYTLRPVQSIASDTSLTSAVYPLDANRWGALPNCDAGCSGLSYSLHWDGDDGSTYGTWSFGSAPANYYDNVVALYTLYYRSGIDTYLTWARTLADNFWESPQWDQGTSCDAFLSVPAVYSPCWPGRSRSMLGLMVRMVEGNLQSTMLPGLRILWTTEKYLATTFWPGRGYIDDLREEGYTTVNLAYCGLLETNSTYSFAFPHTGTDATQQKDCRDALISYSSGVWTPFKTADGGWGTFNSYPGSYTTSINYGNFTGTGNVDVARGSTAVIGHGTTWNCSVMNATTDGLLYFWVPNVNASQTAQSVPGDAYITDGGGDTTYYKAHCNSPTSFTLATPYTGRTGSGKGFAWAPDPASGLSNTFLGWGNQPYAQGIAAIAFEFAGRALDGYNNTARDTYYGYEDRAVGWLINRGLDRTNSGMYLGVMYPCGIAISSNDIMCGNPTYTPDQRRQLSAEVVRALGMSYARTSSAATKTVTDTLMSQMFSRPGTGGPNPDGFYLNQLDPGGFDVAGAPPFGTAPKWTGQDFGFPESGSTWPALRIGGGQLPVDQTVAVNFLLSAITNAQTVRFTVTAPTGVVTQTDCQNSPCMLHVDGRLGDHVARIQYFSGTGTLLAAGQSFLLTLH